MILTRGVIRPVRLAAQDLIASAQRTLTAADQSRAASEQIARNTSDQAGSLQQTAASLQEMAAQTEVFNRETGAANQNALETTQAANAGRTTVGRMTESMDSIKRAAEDTRRIIGTINEIAFQTNLLALNAAVEAARAGDAGMGFAVVAEEVRNLAQRSATAARETESLLEGSRIQADQGAAVAAEVAALLTQIASQAEAVNGQIDKVSTGRDTQTRHIAEIAEAVAMLEQVTQSTAAGAQQSAAGGDELARMSADLQHVATSLGHLVGETTATPVA